MDLWEEIVIIYDIVDRFVRDPDNRRWRERSASANRRCREGTAVVHQ